METLVVLIVIPGIVGIIMALTWNSAALYGEESAKTPPSTVEPRVLTRPPPQSQTGSASFYHPPPILVSQAERDKAIVHLKRAREDDRLTTEALEFRVDLALRVRYRSDLVRLVADLLED